MKKTVLITGAGGFVGKQVLAHLSRDQQLQIRIVELEGSSLPESVQDRVEQVYLTSDFFSEPDKWYENICQDVDLVIHLAWYAEPGKYLLSPKNLDCLIGTLSFAKAAARIGVEKFVGIGTCFEYDLTEGVLSTDTPLKPLSPYAGAKAAAYHSLANFFLHEKTDFLWCRLFYLYGEGEDTRRLYPYVHSKLSAGESVELSSGNQIRDYMNVSEAAERIIKFSFGAMNGAVNICSGKAVTIKEFVEKIADEYGKRSLLRFGVRPENYTDPPKVVGVRTEYD